MLDHDALQRALDVLAGLPDSRPAPGVPRRLDGLFAELQRPVAGRPVFEIEDLIWAVWTDDVPAERGDSMQRAIQAIARRQFEAAEQELDRLIALAPDWPEAWNKRATLYYLLERDTEAVADIIQTLLLEPRHFGALSGLGMICLRHDEPEAARAAFAAALAIHPHLDQIRARYDDLTGLGLGH
jgi:tetratricopeptide (TPR) repeat protein